MNSGLPSVFAWISDGEARRKARAPGTPAPDTARRRPARGSRAAISSNSPRDRRSSAIAEKRMLRQRHLRTAGSVASTSTRMPAKRPRQVIQDVDRRDVRPVQVVEKDDHRPCSETSSKSAPSSRFIRSCDAASASARSSVIDRLRRSDRVATCRYQVGATRLHHRLRADSPPRPVQQAVERLEDRQIRFGAGQALRAAAARDDRPLGARRQISRRKSSIRLVLPMPASPETPR